MKRAVRTFLMLGLPCLSVLLLGLPALLRTGQVDLRSWFMPMLVMVLASAILKIRRGSSAAVWAGLGTVSALLLFVVLVAGRPPSLSAAASLCLVALLAVVGGMLLASRKWAGVLACGAAVLAATLALDRPVVPASAPRPTLGLVSGLPLFWRFDKGGIPVQSDAPLISVLRQSFDVRPIDSPEASQLSTVDVLLLAQPRALTPLELAAVDKWVRLGGRALILVDPMLRWPLPWPVGDRRRPPIITLLTPLIDHWGLRLLPPSSGTAEKRHFLSDGRLLTTYAASAFESFGRSCRVDAAGLVARCTLGKGSAMLVADADLIDDRLWLADPAAPLNTRHWTADTPQFVAEELSGGPSQHDRLWLRTERDLVHATRVAIGFGIFWAAMGAVLLRKKFKASLDRKFTPLISVKDGNRD